MAVAQNIIPLKGIELDLHEENIDEMKAAFIKNFTTDVNDNNRISQDEGSNQYNFTPLEQNEKYCAIVLPAGRNYCAGFYYSKEVNQGYVWVHNSNGDHCIYRYLGDKGTCEMVLKDPCLNIQLDPEHFISESRATIQFATRYNKQEERQERYFLLIYTDNYGDQKMLCPDDLVATNGFNAAQVPFFRIPENGGQRCDLFNLGRATPLGCVSVTPVARNMNDAVEKTRPNLLNFKGWQFRIRQIDQYGRASEHGMISDTYFNQIGNSCLANSSGLPRCLRLRFSAGDPLVDQIQISFRNCAGNTKGFSVASDWYRFTLFGKYNDCQSNLWWERTISNPWQEEYDRRIAAGDNATQAEAAAYAKGLTRYHASDNTFEYTFCADKECVPIPVAETNRIENPLPRASGNVFPLNKGIALARAKRNFEPMDCKELDKVQYVVEAPSGTTCSKVPTRKITIWGVLYNPNTESKVRFRKKDDNIVFGYADCSNNNPLAYDQVLPRDQEGIIGHLKGTDYYTISKQYRYEPLTDTDEFIGLNWQSPGLFSGAFAIQKWEFNVLPGKYRFHISSHKSAPADDYKSTSTYFIGRTALTNVGQVVEEQRELIVDVCSADFTLKETPVMIWDMTHEGKNCTTSSQAASVIAGYLYEDEKEKRPLEMAVLDTNHNDDVFKSTFTDHNGFYFATRQGRVLSANLRGYKNCVLDQVLASTRSTRDTVENWYKFDKLYAYKNETLYPERDRMIIKGRISLCGSPSIGVPGVAVNLTRGGSAVTDSNGEYRIVMHDIGNSELRSDRIIISQRGGCQILACEDTCKFCFPDITVNKTTCSGGERIIEVAAVSARINAVNSKGPKMGGRYGIVQILHDWAGRTSFGQGTDRHYVDIPSIHQTQSYDFSRIRANFNGAKYPGWVKKVSLAITENLNWDDDLTWVMERVQFVDNTGKTNSAAPTQIRLYYESLNEYNKQNDLSTNSTWQFLTEEDDSVTGDTIEFLASADGTIFPTRTTALAKYDKAGKYIQIAYNEDLKDLKDGTLVKLIRPKQCVNKEFYYEICPPIPVVNGQAVNQSVYLNYYDSYMLYRQIPVPRLIKVTATNEDGDEIETSVTDNIITPYPFFFEHHSPADTWGDHCSNRGRVFVKNPLEKERLIRTEIAVSNALVNDGYLNGLHYFEEKDIIVLDEQDWGGIVACIADINNVLVICDYQNFVITYNDNAVRTDESGRVVAPSAENRFGRPQAQGGNDFGCQMKDINTVRRYAGLVWWLDASKSAVVVHNFAQARDVTPSTQNKGGYKSYISSVVKEVLSYNNAGHGKRFFHGVIDPRKKEYLLTVVKVAPANTDAEYVNNERELVIGSSNTLAINMESQAARFYSFTPEYYGSMEGDKDDQQLISFKAGEGWRHNQVNNPANLYNRFYGVDCDKVMEVVFNLDKATVKTFQWTEVLCSQQLFYIDRIITESGQVSRLMPLWWERYNKFSTADFKCDLNTQSDSNLPQETNENALLDGNLLTGRWLKARYIGVAAAKNDYCELSQIIGYMNGVPTK